MFAGLLVTLRLAQAGLNVVAVERAPEIPKQAKATHYAPPAVLELDKAGLVQKCRDLAGWNPVSVCWRDKDFNLLGQLGFNTNDATEAGPGPLDMVCLSQAELCESAIFLSQFPVTTAS